MDYNTISMTEIIESVLKQTPSSRLPKKIKVKSDFYYYLTKNFIDIPICDKDDLPPGYHSYFTGITIEIDDTIKSEYYELVY